MSTLRTVARLGALAVITSLTVLPTTTSAFAADGDYCGPETFKSHTYITKAASSAVVTHAFPKDLAPGSSWTQSFTMQKISEVTAGITTNSEASVSADGILAKAEAKIGVTIQAAGKHTRSSSYTETLDIRNSTKRNRQYVVFSGTTKWTGHWRKTHCNLSTRREYSVSGNWKSWTIQTTSNTTRCDLDPSSRLARRAQALYCG